MSDNNDLQLFRDAQGNTTYQGQINAGNYERATYPGQPQSPQQSWESYDAYLRRINGG